MFVAVYDQAEFDVRCEWGASGLSQLAPISAVVIIIDVLSFSTCVDVVVARKGIVYPFHGSEDAASQFGEEVGAIVADRRNREATYSLSPSRLIAAPEGMHLVLPSPNGSRLSATAGSATTVAACLRNARAVARWVQQRVDETGGGVALIPAGERWWPDDVLRPSYEDWLGAGAVASYLGGSLSPETEAAVAAFRQAEASLPHNLAACSSGKELVAGGHGADVALAAELNASAAVPLLKDGAYQAAV